MNELSLYQMGALQAGQAADALERVNRRIAGHGLVLTREEMLALAQRRQVLLQGNGRVEFGEGILPKLLFAFCDSPYIPPGDFAATLDALMESFYHFKNESAEGLGDDELLAFMKQHFDRDCHGSVELLNGALLESLAHSARTGEPFEPLRELPEDEEEPDE